MVVETVIVAAVAGVMLGWNVHVMRKNGVCCPPPRPDGMPASTSRSATEASKLRRRRHRSSSSRARSAHEKEAEARRKARAAVAGGLGGSTKKAVMDSVLEQQEETPAPPSGAGLSAAGSVNTEGQH